VAAFHLVAGFLLFPVLHIVAQGPVKTPVVWSSMVLPPTMVTGQRALDEVGRVMANDNVSLGKGSLWASIGGVVLPVSLAIRGAIFIKLPSEPGPVRGICILLFILLEFIALGCGIGARRTAAGKAGFIISGILLGLFGVGFILGFVYYLVG
jgi:hypothetical protein